jgi:hypothetical protein
MQEGNGANPRAGAALCARRIGEITIWGELNLLVNDYFRWQ